MNRRFFLAALAIAPALALPCNVRALTSQTVAHNVPYVIGFHPLHSSQTPYLGQLHLNFNRGIVSGTYSDLSIRPGSPFANAHNIAVTGGVSGSQITLNIRQVTFRGTINGNKMEGSATIRGTIYTFAAQQGAPGNAR
jgi:hypothetical protein